VAGCEDDFAAVAAHAQDPVAVFLAGVGGAGAAGFEAAQPEHLDNGVVVDVGRQPGGGDEGFELPMAEASNARNLWMSAVGAYPPGDFQVRGIE
jgi:hypothetical protein